MEVKWIQITTNMFDDEKVKLIDAMPERDTIHYIWIRLLLQAGKTNSHGFIFLNENIPYTEEMLSTIFNRPINSIRLALSILSNLRMIKIDETSVIKITNWDKYQNVEGLEKIKTQNRKRQEKFRNKGKTKLLCSDDNCNVINNVTVTLSNETEQEQQQEQELEQELEQEQELETTTVVVFPTNDIKKNIREIIHNLKDLNITEKDAYDLYNNSNGDLDHIKEVYKFSETQNIRNIIGWLKIMVKPGQFKQPKESNNIKGFNNFEPRKHSERYEYLKEQCLLGQATEEEKKEFNEMRGWDDGNEKVNFEARSYGL